jgi:hypothetical protein
VVVLIKVALTFLLILDVIKFEFGNASGINITSTLAKFVYAEISVIPIAVARNRI